PDPQNETSTLSEGGLDVLDAWLQSQASPPETVAPALQTLVAYQSGMLMAEEVAAVEQGLVRQRASRTLLRESREALLLLRTMPWQEVGERAKTPDTVGQVAQIWLEMVSVQVAAAPPARSLWQTEGLASIRRQLAEGVAEARTAWAAFLS